MPRRSATSSVERWEGRAGRRREPEGGLEEGKGGRRGILLAVVVVNIVVAYQKQMHLSCSLLRAVTLSFSPARERKHLCLIASSVRFRPPPGLLAAMATPTIALPARPAHEAPDPLPELPPELLLSLLTQRGASAGESGRDALDAFVLGGAGGEGGAGGVQVEDILNELLPDGPLASFLSLSHEHPSGADGALLQRPASHRPRWSGCSCAPRSRASAKRSRGSRGCSSATRTRASWANCRNSSAYVPVSLAPKTARLIETPRRTSSRK